ncbi:MAG TPA: 2'-5' RNA ligase family protein [Cryptosporangiaceae bacterium]|nr:2'-5' RNA ligase family protein [Cryptosporangiaceae bacterium]
MGEPRPRTIGVAIEIPAPWGDELDRQRRQAGDPMAAFVPAHVTLLGPTLVDDRDVDSVEKHLRVAASRHRPFELHLRGTGTFRPVTQVVFVAVSRGIAECEQLERDIRTGPLDRELHYPYHPHVTVAHEVPCDQLDAVYERLRGFDATFQVNGFTLFEHGADGRWRPRRAFEFPTATPPPGRPPNL